MTLRTGLAGQIGYVDEVTYGLPVTVTRFLPLVRESISMQIERLESNAQITGRQVLDSTQWGDGAIKVGGDVGHELYDRGIGLLLKWMFGTIGTAGGGPYTHTATPADLAGVSFTTQVGRPDVGATVRAFTYPGCKVASWELACKEGEIATLGLSLLAHAEYRYRTVADGVTATNTILTSATAAFSQADIGIPVSGTGVAAATTILSVESATSVTLSAATTATASGVSITLGQALASASFPSGLVPFRYNKGSVSIAGSSAKVSSATLSGDNKLDERRFLGQPFTDEPLGVDLRDYKGTLEAEFESLTNYNRFVNGGECALVLAFSAGASRTLTITCNVRFDDAKVNVQGRGITKLTLPFKCIGTTDAAAITAVAVNSDAAA